MRAMSLAADDSEGEQNEIRSLQTQLDLTGLLVKSLATQLTELKDQITFSADDLATEIEAPLRFTSAQPRIHANAWPVLRETLDPLMSFYSANSCYGTLHGVKLILHLVDPTLLVTLMTDPQGVDYYTNTQTIPPRLLTPTFANRPPLRLTPLEEKKGGVVGDQTQKEEEVLVFVFGDRMEEEDSSDPLTNAAADNETAEVGIDGIEWGVLGASNKENLNPSPANRKD